MKLKLVQAEDKRYISCKQKNQNKKNGCGSWCGFFGNKGQNSSKWEKYGLGCLSMSLSGITLLGRRGCPAQQHPWLLLATTAPVPVTNSDSRHCQVVPGRHIKSGRQTKCSMEQLPTFPTCWPTHSPCYLDSTPLDRHVPVLENLLHLGNSKHCFSS